MTWGKRMVIVALLLLLSEVAWAEPAGDTGYVPIGMTSSSLPADSVVVEPGDHLWKLSQDHLDAKLGRVAGPEEVTPYWLAVIQANRDRLRSGDPDLIFPGEVIEMPAESPA